MLHSISVEKSPKITSCGINRSMPTPSCVVLVGMVKCLLASVSIGETDSFSIYFPFILQISLQCHCNLMQFLSPYPRAKGVEQRAPGVMTGQQYKLTPVEMQFCWFKVKLVFHVLASTLQKGWWFLVS